MNREQDASDGSNMATRPAISLMRRAAVRRRGVERLANALRWQTGAAGYTED